MTQINPVFSIRKAKLSDAPFLAKLSGELGYPSTKKEMIFRLKPILSDSSHAVFAAETARKRVVGWIHVCVRNCIEENLFAELVGLVVSREFRGKGIGGFLLRKAEEWAFNKNLQTICLRSRTTRKEAHQFYKHLGYEIVKTQKVFKRVLNTSIE